MSSIPNRRYLIRRLCLWQQNLNVCLFVKCCLPLAEEIGGLVNVSKSDRLTHKLIGRLWQNRQADGLYM